MKTFLNVLYRRILYKIPLKLLLVLLAVFGVLFACFSDAGLVKSSYQSYVGNQASSYSNTSCDMICINPDGNNCRDINLAFNLNAGSNAWSIRGGGFIGNTYGFCTPEKTIYFSTFDGCNFTIDCYNFTEYTSMQCQIEYNLIPVESVDENYCTSNNLCPSIECPVFTGEYSQLYINNILHLGAPNIIMNIPDEIDWDYAYTQGGQNMNIDVVGYNVDYEKIDQIVQLQNYKPTSEDFQKIIGLLAPYTKIIVFFVFLFIVWAWIKKPFKSKKL